VGVDHGRAEEQRAVDQLRPLVSPDIVGDRRLHEGAEQPGQLARARRDATVELAQYEGAVTAVQDAPRSDPVCRPVDQAAHCALGAYGLRDQLLAESILERHDGAAGGEPRRDVVERSRSMVALDGEEDQRKVPAEARGHHCPHSRGRRPALALDGEPMGVDGLDVGRVAVDEKHLVAGAREGGAGGASDRASAVNRDHHRAPQVPQAAGAVNARRCAAIPR
jgi:hypothetical protein